MRIVADTINKHFTRLTTFVITIPTCLLAELRTHRLFKWSDTDFSINANSDRAIPVKDKIERLKKYFYLPEVSLSNKGMVGIEDVSTGIKSKASSIWLESKDLAINQCEKLLELGLHKQYINRLLMPFSLSDVVITGDDRAYENFFNLRTTKETEPNFRKIAIEMKQLYDTNFPRKGNLHIAFFKDIMDTYGNILEKDDKLGLDLCLIISASMCARVSYNINKKENIIKHIQRAKTCFNGKHYSVFEHQAITLEDYKKDKKYISNTENWLLLRRQLELNETILDFEKILEHFQLSNSQEIQS